MAPATNHNRHVLTLKLLTEEDLLDILYGAVILGAGGGGDLEEGKSLIAEALEADKTFKLVDINEVADDALICTPYLLGAISPMSEKEEEQYKGLSRCDKHPILIAYEEFQKHLGRSFYATTACELGGSNTAVAFYCAAMNDHYVLDADPAGRAVPEITHSTYYLAGLPASPIFTANEFGETFVLSNVKDDQRAEALVRALCKVSRNDIAAIDHALDMHMLRDVLIPGTISKSMQLGRVWRESKVSGNAIQRVAEVGGGRIAFSGIVNAVDYQTKDGFTIGEVEIIGTDVYEGHSFKIKIKNENLVGWKNDDVYVTIPDLICLFDTDNDNPVSNPDVKMGQSITVILLPAPEQLTTSQALSVFGPMYAGIEQDYLPVFQHKY